MIWGEMIWGDINCGDIIGGDMIWGDMIWIEMNVEWNERGPVVNFFENNCFKSSLENEMVLVVRAVKCGNVAAEEMSGV